MNKTYKIIKRVFIIPILVITILGTSLYASYMQPTTVQAAVLTGNPFIDVFITALMFTGFSITSRENADTALSDFMDFIMRLSSNLWDEDAYENYVKLKCSDELEKWKSKTKTNWKNMTEANKWLEVHNVWTKAEYEASSSSLSYDDWLRQEYINKNPFENSEHAATFICPLNLVIAAAIEDGYYESHYSIEQWKSVDGTFSILVMLIKDYLTGLAQRIYNSDLFLLAKSIGQNFILSTVYNSTFYTFFNSQKFNTMIQNYTFFDETGFNKYYGNIMVCTNKFFSEISERNLRSFAKLKDFAIMYRVYEGGSVQMCIINATGYRGNDYVPLTSIYSQVYTGSSGIYYYAHYNYENGDFENRLKFEILNSVIVDSDTDISKNGDLISRLSPYDFSYDSSCYYNSYYNSTDLVKYYDLIIPFFNENFLMDMKNVESTYVPEQTYDIDTGLSVNLPTYDIDKTNTDKSDAAIAANIDVDNVNVSSVDAVIDNTRDLTDDKVVAIDNVIDKTISDAISNTKDDVKDDTKDDVKDDTKDDTKDDVKDDTDTKDDVNTDVNVPDDMKDYTPKLIDLFPFCIPFDIYRFLKCLAADPEAPVIDFPLITENSFGIPPFTLHLDFSKFDSVAKVLRTMELLGFCVGLAFVTNNLIKH